MPKKDFFANMFDGEIYKIFCKILRNIILDFLNKIQLDFFSKILYCYLFCSYWLFFNTNTSACRYIKQFGDVFLFFL
jgi:hypothetical protein